MKHPLFSPSVRRALRVLINPIGVACLTAFLMMAAMPAQAQLAGKGAVSGTIQDPTGASIPGATIVITNTATNIATTLTSNSAGEYSASTLDPGNYSILVTASGFQTLAQKNVQVNALETQTFSPKMTIGGADQTVTVSTLPPQLETSSAQLGTTMDQETYSALPIEMGAYGQPDQRRATDFAALLPGVQVNETNGNATTNTGVVNGSGSRGAASAVYIDGIPFTSAAGEGDPRFVWTAISVDAVNQFQVETSGYPAMYMGQGIENFTVKQGGSQYHAAVYEFLRNTALDTWGFFKSTNPVTGLLQKPVEHQNEYGILISGPLVPFGSLKDKLFFFGNYNGFRYSHSAPQAITFPNLAEQGGNFQGIQPIYDPSTQTACTAAHGGAQCRYRFGMTAAGGTSNCPTAPGSCLDIIPAAQISAVAAAMQAAIPTLTNQNATNNYIAQNYSALSNWSTTERIDYNINAKHQLTFVAALGRQGSSVPVGQTTAGRGTGPLPYNYSQAYAPKTAVGIVEDTYTFTPHIVNQLKYGFGRYNGPTINADYTPAYAASNYGITGLPTGQSQGAFPITSFSGTDAPTQWAGTTASSAISNSYTLLDNLQWNLGKHSITIGGEFDWIQYQSNTALSGNSPVTYSNAVTETAGFTNSTTLTPSTGVAYASFLLGQIDKASLTSNLVQETGARFRPISPYIQDNWKVSSKLTLDLGLRWDYFPTYQEAHNVLSFFNPTLTNPVTGAPGAIQYAGSGANTCNCSTPVNNYFKNFGPRLGFAYQSDAKTVWRGSWGVMYTHGNGVAGSAISRTGTGTLGFSAAPSFSSSTSTFLSTAPLPAFPAFTPATGRASGNAYGTGYTTTAGYTGTPQSLGYGDPYLGGRAPQYINYTLGFQHQWTDTFTTTISYVGSQGHFLITDGGNARGYYADQLDPKYLPLGSCLGAAVSKLATTTYNGVNCNTLLANANIAVPAWFSTSQSLSTALVPFPQYKVSDSYGNVANSNYNALQATAMKRFSHGVNFMANYTWSRTIDDGGTFRSGYAIPASVSNNGKSWAPDTIERSVSTSNQPHHFVFTGIEALPFGSGKLGGQHSWSRAIFGGFKFSEILQMYSGSPLALTASAGQTNPAAAVIQPMLNPNFTGSARVNGRWGSGSTYGNLKSYITPSTCTSTTTASGPFIAPTTACLNTALAPAYTFGNAPRTQPLGLTGPGFFGLDLSLRRTFNLHAYNSKLSLEADLFNVTNYVQFGGIGVTLGSATFGVPASQLNNSRAAQLSGRFEF